MNNCLFTILILLLIPFSKVSSAKTITIDKDIYKDATLNIQNILNNNSDVKDLTLSFSPGIYNFYPDKAKEKYLYISNHDDHLSRIAFNIENFKNITINGNGAHFIMHGVIIPFLVEKSENVTIKNLSIDWKNPFHSQGVVIATNVKNKTFDVQFSSDYPYEIRNGKVIFLKEYYSHDANQSIFFDPKTKGPLFKTELINPSPYSYENSTSFFPDKNVIHYPYPKDKQETFFRDLGHSTISNIKEIKPGVLRFNNRKDLFPPIGSLYVCKGRQDYNRIAPAIFLHKTTNTTIENVIIYNAGGMGILGQNSQDINLNKVKITPSSNRIVSASADASHFVGCRGLIHLNNCLFENQLDDGMNVHGAYQIIQDKLSKNTIGARVGHFQQLGFTLARKNDTIGFVDINKSFKPYAKAVVKNIYFINGRFQKIEFTKPLPENIKLGDLMENLSAYPNLLVENSKFQHNRARGLLISNPKKTIVRNCYFETEMDGLLFPVENSKWYESGNACNVLIENNTFKNCVTMGKERAVIRFATDGDNSSVAFKNITIRGNIFNQYDNAIMSITNVNGLNFEDNIIKTNNDYPNLFPNAPAIEISKSKNIYFKKNKYLGKAKVLVYDKDKKIEFKSFKKYNKINK